MFSNLANSALRWTTAASLTLAVCTGIAIISAAPAESLEGEPEQQFVLEGLSGVHVTVPAITGMDAQRDEIARAVAQRISASGMKVIDDKEFLNYTDVKSLVVRISPLKHGGKTFYSLNLDLTQMIYLQENQSRRVTVSMWDNVSVGLVDSNKDGQITEDVLKHVDKFIDMWRRANGKKDD